MRKTTAGLAAMPTPCVTDLHWYPLQQPTIPMAKPRKTF